RQRGERNVAFQPAHSISIIEPSLTLRGESGLRPGQELFFRKFCETRCSLLLANSNLAFSQAGAVCRFYLTRNLIVALLGGFPHELALPHELVPVHFATFVDAHCLPRFPDFLPLPFGRPPSFPHSRIRR